MVVEIINNVSIYKAPYKPQRRLRDRAELSSLLDADKIELPGQKMTGCVMVASSSEKHQ